MPAFQVAGNTAAEVYPLMTGGGSGEYGLAGGAGGGGGPDGYGLGYDVGARQMGADLPAFGIREGRVAIDAPVLPFFGMVAGAIGLGATKLGGWGYLVGAFAGYYVTKLAVIGIQGQNIQRNL